MIIDVLWALTRMQDDQVALTLVVLRLRYPRTKLTFN